MQSRWTYILIGDDRTGKTTLQKKLIYELCGLYFDRLDTNRAFDISHRGASRHLKTLFTINRSYQEKKQDYGSVSSYFKGFFREESVCILSSHSSGCTDEIREMIEECHARFYNVAGVFFSNAIDDEVREISKSLPWDERLYLSNPYTEDSDTIQNQLSDITQFMVQLITRRSHFQ